MTAATTTLLTRRSLPGRHALVARAALVLWCCGVALASVAATPF